MRPKLSFLAVLLGVFLFALGATIVLLGDGKMSQRLCLLAVLLGVFLLALGATLAWGTPASADDPTPTAIPSGPVVIATVSVGSSPIGMAANPATNGRGPPGSHAPALVGLAAGGALLLAIGAWHARRRWRAE